MTYLHKLASRMSRIRTALPLLILSASACTKGEKVDFLGPDPSSPSPKVQSIRIDPKVGSALVGTTIKFTAIGYTATGFPTPVAIDWVAQGGSISANGDYTATSTGQFTVIARARENAAVADSASVEVWNTQTDQISLIVSPDSSHIDAGESLDFTAAVLMVNGTAAGNTNVLWSADGGSITTGGRFTVGQSGTYTVSAVTANGLRGYAQVFVGAEPRTLQSVIVNPGTSTVTAGSTIAFIATGLYSDGTSGPPSVAWSASGGSINSQGTYTAGSQAGNYWVVAQNAQGTVADTASVTISGLNVVGLSITPKTISLQPSATTTFTTLARLSDGSFRTTSVSYQATGGTMSANGAYIAGSATGTYLAIVTAPGIAGADTATITIAQPVATLTGILLNPATASLGTGQSRQFAVAGVWSDGSGLSPAVSWAASGGSVTPTGLYTAGSIPGTFVVVASTPSGKADTSAVTVVPAVLSSLSLTPSTGSLVVGQTLQLSVAGIWSDGSTSAPAVGWNATGGTVSSAGLFAAGGSPGTYRVIATQQGGTLADTSLITIAPPAPVLSSIVLSPGSVVLPQAGVRQFTAVGVWSDGSASTPSLTWTATGGTITGSGLYTAGLTAGSFRVIAAGGGKADTAAVTLTASGPIVTSFVMTPGTATVPASGTLQFQSAITWSDGVNHPATVSHSATGGTISMNGVFVAGPLAGTFAVIATCSCGVADTSSVLISAASSPVLTTLQLTPAVFSLAPGAGQQLGISYTWSNGSTTPPPVDYSATAGSVSGGGLYTAPMSAGNYQIVVSHTGGTRRDTSVVTVTTAPAPPPPPPPAGPPSMYFNSSEAGCGTDPNILLCDDFEDGEWYGKNCDQANGSGGLLQADGWCGTIYNNAGMAAGTARCGGVGVNSACAATTGGMFGGSTGNMADHALLNGQGVNEIWVRFYTKPLSGYQFGAEKMLTFNDGVPGGAGIKWGNLAWNCAAGGAASTGYIHMGFPGPAMDVCQGQNLGNNITIQTGNWYFYEVHYRLGSPGQADGVFELWVDNCGPDGTTCPATPTLRMRRTDIKNNRVSTSELIRVLWFEAWSNPVSRGERYWDQIKVSKGGPIGFMQ